MPGFIFWLLILGADGKSAVAIPEASARECTGQAAELQKQHAPVTTYCIKGLPPARLVN